MITSMVKKQLLVFWTAAVVATVVLAIVFLRVPEAVGYGRYVVTAEFDQAAGLYDGAQVNFRGSPVGKVTDLALTEERIEVELTLKDDVDLPEDVRVEIHSMSAVGEQYVELVPPAGSTASGTLADGDRIPAERTSFPVEIGPVLDNVDALVRSVPRDDLDTVLEEAALAFEGRDGDLQAILDGSQEFLEDAGEAFEPTSKLIQDTGPLLNAVNGRAGNIDALTRNLARVTDELRAGDADLRRLLADGPAFAATSSDLLDDLTLVLPPLLKPLGVISRLLSTYRDNVGQLLSDYPVALSVVQSVNLRDLGQHEIALTLANISKPGECLVGFLPVSQWRSPFDTSLVDPRLLYCTEGADDPRAVRGARNIPCVENPGQRAGTVARCRD